MFLLFPLSTLRHSYYNMIDYIPYAVLHTQWLFSKYQSVLLKTFTSFTQSPMLEWRGKVEAWIRRNRVIKTWELWWAEDTKSKRHSLFLSWNVCKFAFSHPLPPSSNPICFLIRLSKGPIWEVGFMRLEQLFTFSSFPAPREQFWFTAFPTQQPWAPWAEIGVAGESALPPSGGRSRELVAVEAWRVRKVCNVYIRALTWHGVLSLDRSEPLYLVQHCRVHGPWIQNEWANGWVCEGTCWKPSAPALLSFALHSNDQHCAPLWGDDSLAHVPVVSGLWSKYVRWVPVRCKSRDNSFYHPQNTESPPGEPCLWPGLKFLSLLPFKG